MGIFFSLKDLLFCMYVLFCRSFLNHVFRSPQKPGASVEPLGTGVTDDWESPCGCWKLNLILARTTSTLTAEPSPQPLNIDLKIKSMREQITFMWNAYMHNLDSIMLKISNLPKISHSYNK